MGYDNMATRIEVKFAHVSGHEVFEPTDWLGNFFVPIRNRQLETGTALRVRKVGHAWRPFDERPLHAEHSYFCSDELGQIVGHFNRSRA